MAVAENLPATAFGTASPRLDGQGWRGWQLRWPAGLPVPRWVASLHDSLGSQVGEKGGWAAAPSQPPAPLNSLAWRLDAVLFGAARELEPSPVAPTVPWSASLSPVVDLSGGEAPQAGLVLRLSVEDQPALRLAFAVQQALDQGRGSVAVSAQWRWAGEPGWQSLRWLAHVDERSRHRASAQVARKLSQLALHVAAALSAGTDPSSPCAPPVSAYASRGTPISRGWQHLVRRALLREQWAVRLFTGVAGGELLPRGPAIDLLPPADRFWADPLPVRQGDRCWMFVEELPYATGRGHISCLPVDGPGRVGEAVPVLQEPCHLSYPQVMLHDGQWYMVPESSQRRNLVLYRATRFPDRWEPVAELLEGVRLADATFVREAGRWWMTASAASDDGCIYDELHMYTAERLEGPWQPLPGNPQRVDAATSRPAGPWFRHQGGWVRPAQDCRGRYGRALQLLAVQSIGDMPGGLREQVVASIEPFGATDGVHTYARQGTDLAIDWLRWRPKHGGSGARSPQVELKVPR